MAYTQQHADDNKRLDQRARDLLTQQGWTLAGENAAADWQTYTQSIVDSVLPALRAEFPHIKPNRVRQHTYHQITLMRGEQRKRKQ